LQERRGSSSLYGAADDGMSVTLSIRQRKESLQAVAKRKDPLSSTLLWIMQGPFVLFRGKRKKARAFPVPEREGISLVFKGLSSLLRDSL